MKKKRAWSLNADGTLIFPNTTLGDEAVRDVARPIMPFSSIKAKSLLAGPTSNVVQFAAPSVDVNSGAVTMIENRVDVCAVHIEMHCVNPNCVACSGVPRFIIVTPDLNGVSQWDTQDGNFPALEYLHGTTVTVGPFPSEVLGCSAPCIHLFQGLKVDFTCGMATIQTTASSITFTLPTKAECDAASTGCQAVVSAFYEAFTSFTGLDVCNSCGSFDTTFTCTSSSPDTEPQHPNCGQTQLDITNAAVAAQAGMSGTHFGTNACSGGVDVAGFHGTFEDPDTGCLHDFTKHFSIAGGAQVWWADPNTVCGNPSRLVLGRYSFFMGGGVGVSRNQPIPPQCFVPLWPCIDTSPSGYAESGRDFNGNLTWHILGVATTSGEACALAPPYPGTVMINRPADLTQGGGMSAIIARS